LVRAQRRAGHCMSPSWLRAVPPSMFSIMPRSRRGRRQRRAGAQAPLPRQLLRRRRQQYRNLMPRP
jgi:hypothetical protein